MDCMALCGLLDLMCETLVSSAMYQASNNGVWGSVVCCIVQLLSEDFGLFDENTIVTFAILGFHKVPDTLA